MDGRIKGSGGEYEQDSQVHGMHHWHEQLVKTTKLGRKRPINSTQGGCDNWKGMPTNGLRELEAYHMPFLSVCVPC